MTMKKNIDLKINIAGVTLQNPVVMASGTFGYGSEIADLIPLNKLGAIITKTVTRKPKAGNPPVRIAETASGMLNTVGLQNIGIDRFLDEEWTELKKIGVPFFVSIAGETAEDYMFMAEKLSTVKGISGIELNLSCPNLQKRIICQDRVLVESIVRRCSDVSPLPLIAKLSPMVEDIAALAKLCETAGAKAISAVNTFTGMAVDINTRKPKLSTVTGGLSGPAIKPLALRCVWEICKAVNIPVIGGGGITTAEDALEFILAGATAVSVGTAVFIKPEAPIEIIEGIEKHLSVHSISSLEALRGTLIV